MEIVIRLTEEEILNIPNDSLLGEFVRNKYWQKRRNQESTPIDDDVKNTIKPFTCSICGKDTSEIEYDYLSGYDHLSCQLKVEIGDEYDHCVICNKKTPYLRSTHIDQRIGYVEGAGQLCRDCYHN